MHPRSRWYVSPGALASTGRGARFDPRHDAGSGCPHAAAAPAPRRIAMAHVTFIHGIANKPAEPELLRIWRDALADGSDPLPLGDHGVTSTMVYWADLMYPAQETPWTLSGTAGRHRLRPAKKHDRADAHPRPQAPETAGNGVIHAPVHRSCAPRTAGPAGAKFADTARACSAAPCTSHAFAPGSIPGPSSASVPSPRMSHHNGETAGIRAAWRRVSSALSARRRSPGRLSSCPPGSGRPRRWHGPAPPDERAIRPGLLRPLAWGA